jgi:hypothetical protein
MMFFLHFIGLMEAHPSIANRIFKNVAQILERQATQFLENFDAKRDFQPNK